MRRDSQRTLKQSPHAYHVFIEIVAGGGAGAISRTLVAPLERVKVLLQVQNSSSAVQYDGIIDCLKRIPKEQGGFLAFWRGNGVNVARMIPNSAIKFSTFDYYKSIALPYGEDYYSPFELVSRKLLCGALCGVSTMVPVYPLDVARTRLTADVSENRRYHGLFDCLNKTYAQGGIRGLYRGIGISLSGIVPYLAINLTLYDTLKDSVSGHRFFATPFGWMVLGSTSALVSQTITFPLDTVRRRMQVAGQLGNMDFPSAWQCILHISRTSGIRGFYRGVLANALRAAPQTGLEFATYDFIRKSLRDL